MVDVNAQHCFNRLQVDFNFALQITKEPINKIMDEKHPNTAEEVVHPFKFKWIREKHKGKKTASSNGKGRYFLFVHKPCKNLTDKITL